MDRRSFLSLACVSGSGLLRFQERGQKEPPFERADRLLKSGRNFEEAAELLRQVIGEEPQNYRASLALACACANRAATLLRAYEFTRILDHLRKVYPAYSKVWNTEQQRLMNYVPSIFDSKKLPRPNQPPAYLRTRDDGKPFRLTTDELKSAVSALMAEGESALHHAAEVAETPEEKADVLWYRAWITRLLETADTLVWPQKMRKGEVVKEYLFPVPDIKAARTDMEEALRLTPEFARCWEGLGDLWEYGGRFSDVTDTQKAVDAYRQAVKYQPENAPLWFHLFFLEQAKDAPRYEPFYDESAAPPPRQYSNPNALRFYLKQAAHYDPANGAYALQEAYLLNHDLDFASYDYNGWSLYMPLTPIRDASDEARAYREEEEQKRVEDLKKYREKLAGVGNRAGIESVLALVEKAVSATRLDPPLYRGRPPEWLRFPWEYYVLSTYVSSWLSAYPELESGLSGYAMFVAREEKSSDIAGRVCPVLIALGQRLVGDWSLTELGSKSGHDFSTVNTGIDIVRGGYGAWDDALKTAGSGDERRAFVAKERAAFNENVARFEESILPLTEGFDRELLGY